MNATISPAAPRFQTFWRRYKPWLIAAVVFMTVAGTVGFHLVSEYWPYRYREIKPLLEQDFGSQMQIASYHRVYFPSPGFVAIGVRLHRRNAPNAPDIGSADKMVVEGRWAYLFSLQRRVARVEVTGLHVTIPPPHSRAVQEDFPPGSSADFAGPDTQIDEFILHNSLLDLAREDGSRLSFAIAEVSFRNVKKGKPADYLVDMQNPLPRGRIIASGSFGPLNANDLAATPVSGKFTFTAVRLADVGEIRGTLSSAGIFHGSLGAIQADVRARTPDFAVSSGRSSPVDGSVQCTIDALHGDLGLQNISVRLGDTAIHATGTISGTPNATNLDIDVKQGRAQDVMRPFVHDEPPIAGPLWLHAHAFLAPSGNNAGFLKRLHVTGTFDVPAERATDKQTERSISAFSQRAQTHKSDQNSDPPDASSPARDTLSRLEGPVSVENGVASSRHLAFAIPGAHAILSGQFNFENKNVHLVGTMTMQSDISHATTGFKSFLLKPLAPFFKKKHAGAVVPIAVIGSPGHYQITQDLSHDK